MYGAFQRRQDNMDGNVLVITNGTIITPVRVVPGASVIIEDGQISHVISRHSLMPHEIATNGGMTVINAENRYVCPGFIDMHVHGGGGADLMDCTPDAVLTMARTHAEGGTTSIVPTTTCSSLQDIFMVLDNIRDAKCVPNDGANILGIHLEGPYLSPLEVGAQDPRYIRTPKEAEYKKLLDYSEDILCMTVAPEIPGGLQLGSELRRRGIVASMGHTDATFDDVVLAVEAGFSHVTHLYSSMPSVRRRDLFRVAGVVEAAYVLNDYLTVEVIADGKHLPPALLSLVYQTKGPCRTAVITDAMRGAGMPEGEYVLGGNKDGLSVIVEDGVAKLTDKSAFAGSIALTHQLVRNMVELAHVPVEDAVRMASLTPATILGLSSRKGRIAPGMDGDIVVLDEDLSVEMTIVGGRIVYDKTRVIRCDPQRYPSQIIEESILKGCRWYAGK